MKAAPVKSQTSLYQALPHTLLRAPLLPVESYLRLSSEEFQDLLLADGRVRAALVVGSTSLLSAVDRFQPGLLNKRDSDRMRAKLRRYLIRMATRPTPYGLFAGVALAPFGNETNVTLQNSARSRTRPDMAWLMQLVLRAEAKPEVRNQLCWFANPAAFEAAGRLFLQERAATAEDGSRKPVSVRSTGVVRRAMSMARTPIPYCQLAAELERATPNGTPAKIEKLLTELFEQTFLLTELRPPLTIEDPSAYVRDKLSGIKAAKEISLQLEHFLRAISDWDNAASLEKPAKFWNLLEAADVPLDGSKPSPVQADLNLSVSGAVGQIIAKEAAEAAELLLRLCAYPGGLGGLTAYRQAYVNRFGPHREVPLLELVDPQLGLGPVGSRGYAHVGPTAAKSAERARVLTDLACRALRKKESIVDLDDELVRRLQTSEASAETAPVSLDINVQIAASSAADIDNGNFQIIIGPNLGAQAAGRNLGRFADLIGPEGRTLLQQIAAAEAHHVKEEIEAEIVYLPPNQRMANVVIRPAVRPYEVPFGVMAAVDASKTIALSDLVAGVENNRFYVRWKRTGQRVRFTSGHMLTHHGAPAVIRFLSEVSSDGRMMFNSFDWGPVENFPFLPRVQKGRTVLRPAQWRIDKNTLPQLDNWRREWLVPRHICLSAGDNRLILDLDQEVEAEELRSELKRLPEGGTLMVQEVLPDLNEAWLTGAEGHYFSEMVVSLVLRPQPQTNATKPAATQAISLNGFHPLPSRNRPPGSEWLFVKLYCPRQFEDDMIAEPLLAFADEAITTQLADSWFYIRYSDPERHIRLRFRGQPERLANDLFPRLSRWAGSWLEQGIFSKFVFDTYEQEVERFGGSEGLKASEEIFAADSRSCARLLRCVRKNSWPKDETTFLALSIDHLLASIGLSEDERTVWYGKQTNARGSDIGEAYRKRKDNLRKAVGDPDAFLSEFAFGAELSEILAERRRASAAAGLHLRQLQDEHRLSQPIDDLCSSFVHLQFNRLSSGDGPSEHHVLGLLQRTRQSLRNAPVKR